MVSFNAALAATPSIRRPAKTKKIVSIVAVESMIVAAAGAVAIARGLVVLKSEITLTRSAATFLKK